MKVCLKIKIVIEVIYMCVFCSFYCDCKFR